MANDPETLLEKIRRLPDHRIAEVEGFIEFIHQREEELALTRAAAQASTASFAAIWSNPEDGVYDAL